MTGVDTILLILIMVLFICNWVLCVRVEKLEDWRRNDQATWKESKK